MHENRRVRLTLTSEELDALFEGGVVYRRALVEKSSPGDPINCLSAEEISVELEADAAGRDVPPKFECDCGRRYADVRSVYACQTRNHGALPNPPSRREDMRGERSHG